MNVIVINSILSIFLAFVPLSTNADEDEELYKYVFDDYNSDVKPHNESGPVTINLSVEIKQLIEMSSKQQYILLSVWKIQQWYDPHLYWDPKNFSGEDHMHANEENIWTPDTFLFNTLDLDEDATEKKMPVKLFSYPELNSTLVIQRRPAFLRTSCLMDVKFFPWDVQTCHLNFGSWSYPLEEMDYHHPMPAFYLDEEFIPNQEWIIHSLLAKREVHRHHGNAVSTLVFEIVLWRLPMYYIFNLIVPTVIITIISFLGLFSLTSSSGERGEKVSLGMGTILAPVVVMLMVDDAMPTTSLTNPMISWYLLILIALIALALLTTVFIVKLQNYKTTGTPIPSWVKSICRIEDNNKNGHQDKTSDRSSIVLQRHSGTVEKQITSTPLRQGYDYKQETLEEIACSLRDVKHCMKEVLKMQENQVLMLESSPGYDEYHLVATKLEFVCFIFFTVFTLMVTFIYLFLGYSSR